MERKKRIYIFLNLSDASLIKKSVLLLFLIFLPANSAVASNGKRVADLFDMDIKSLMNIEVTSVSKKAEKISETAAAVYVITQEDIRRSGAVSIPEALRMVPGLTVARADGNSWAISSRGFNGVRADKLLVLIDGRSIYTPLYSGVVWGRQDTMLEDIERIEVIRGPGATVWGANAVNGIINIITKNAADTQNLLVTAGAGTEEKGVAAGRYGGKIGEKTFYRLYVKHTDRDGMVDTSGEDLEDNWKDRRAGFRVDSQVSQTDSLMVQGDIYGTDFGFTEDGRSGRSSDEHKVYGGHILGRWERTFSEDSEMTVQLYYDRTERMEETSDEFINTYDIDFYHNFSPAPKHAITWGAGYRNISFNNKVTGFNYYLQPKRTDNLYSAFMQDKVTLSPDRLFWTIGTKYEDNDYTGIEIQPSTRLLYVKDSRHSMWLGLSRAVRTPARANHDLGLILDFGFGPIDILIPLREMKAEELTAYELGYRVTPSDTFSVDIATFYNVYDKLETIECEQPADYPCWEGNKGNANTYGAEVSAKWAVKNNWRLMASFSYFKAQFEYDEGSLDLDYTKRDVEGSSPESQAHLRSYWDLPNNMEFDTALYYVDSIKYLDISSYTRVDARVGWAPTENINLSLIVQNVFDERHQEFSASRAIEEEVERSVFLKFVWSN